ncbi:MAG: hypothetical protein V3V20_07740 [Algisphaera sp.]
MTSDREAACWLVAALAVVVATFSAAGCRSAEPFVAGSPTVRWTITDEADALPALVAAAAADSQGNASSDTIESPWVPVTTLGGAAQLDAVMVPSNDFLMEETSNDVAPADEPEGATLGGMHGGAAGPGNTPSGDARSMAVVPAGLGSGWLNVFSIASLALSPWAATASPTTLALAIAVATVLFFVIQGIALVRVTRPKPQGHVLRLTDNASPHPRPPAGGMARPLPFPSMVVVSGIQFAQAA